jgi:uncharacterized membrane protein YkvA (DUF1232 family)
MDSDQPGFGKEYSEASFRDKLFNFAKTAGREVVERALQLYFAAQASGTPTWAKSVIYGALGYFVFPLDAIPDPMPLVGYTDDLGVLAAAVATVAMYITEDVKEKARQKLNDWFA